MCKFVFKKPIRPIGDQSDNLSDISKVDCTTVIVLAICYFNCNDQLITITGKNPPPRSRPAPRLMTVDRSSSRIPDSMMHNPTNAEHDLHTFREALEIHGI